MRFSLVILRHGERAPNNLYNHLIDGPGFVVKAKELTKKGAESNYQIGKQLRNKFKENGLINIQKYCSNEVYAKATFKTRTIGSAKALLQGLYGLDLEFPLVSQNNLVVGTHS